jgi:hypothetical protein
MDGDLQPRAIRGADFSLPARSGAAYMARTAFASMTPRDGSTDVEESGPQGFERWRRALSWVCISVFSLSFAGLLGLSSTVYWAPDNPWIAILDRAWRISGFTGLCLWVIPYVARGGRWVGEAFSGKG